MKLLFSIMFFITSIQASTNYIQLSYKKENTDYAIKIHRTLIRRFKIPQNMIELKEVKRKCENETLARALYLCVGKNDFEIYFRNQRVLNETLGVFWK